MVWSPNGSDIIRGLLKEGNESLLIFHRNNVTRIITAYYFILRHVHTTVLKIKAEDLLAALEKGGKGQNETLKHIQEINTHLSAVAQAALLLEQHRPSSAGGSTSRSHRLSSDPGISNIHLLHV